MKHDTPHSASAEAVIVEQAQNWIARRDRGLTTQEKQAFAAWLRADLQHRLIFSREEETWKRLDGLLAWQPQHTRVPNPDLLAPAKVDWPWRRVVAIAASVAVLLAGGGALYRSLAPDAAVIAAKSGVRILPGPGLHRLADGSELELRTGRFTVAFTEEERRVKLLEGELHVTVAKQPARPFLIEVDGTVVRATGTAFAVRRGTAQLDVLVTEGSVHVNREQELAWRESGIDLAAGTRARFDPRKPESISALATIEPVSAATLEMELAWRGMRVEFENVPLSVAAAEFNARNAQQIVVTDEVAARLQIAGTFGLDHVDAFARLLETAFDLRVDRGSAVWRVESKRPAAIGK